MLHTLHAGSLRLFIHPSIRPIDGHQQWWPVGVLVTTLWAGDIDQ